MKIEIVMNTSQDQLRFPPKVNVWLVQYFLLK